jgi:hypothetical protein
MWIHEEMKKQFYPNIRLWLFIYTLGNAQLQQQTKATE